ncbi:MAG: ATP-binding protein [Candidatus Omnitrophota bacterium]|jgi:two-component system phosphate regulon sensor histidine kinase PhoR
MAIVLRWIRKKINSRNFIFKLTFSYVFIILISFGFIAFSLDKKLEENALQDIKASLVNQAYLIETQISSEALIKENTAFLDPLARELGHKIKCRVTILNKRGKVLADSEKTSTEALEMENHIDRPEIKAALSGLTGEEIRYSTTLKMDMLYVALPVRGGPEITGILRLALPLSDLREILFAIRKAIFFSLFFALGLAFVLGSLLTRAVIKPINKMIYASRKFSQGDFSHKIYLDSRDELGELAVTLNTMAQNLEDNINEIKVKNQHLTAILESMAEGIIVVDKDSRIVSVNPTIEKIFNISKNDLTGRSFLEAIRNNDMADIINEVLDKGRFTSRELSLVLPVQRTFQVNASPVFDKDLVSACLLVIHDITEIRKLETMRRDFVANVSHELKTPLTSIKGFTETLLEGGLDDKDNNIHFLKIIHAHAERLDKLVNDLLSLSYIESKEILLEKEVFNLREEAEKVIAGFTAQVKIKNIDIKNELDARLTIKADRDRIEQVFTNLIDNAIKFNREKGAVSIYSLEESNRLKVVIEDSGAGIPGKDVPRIFERFYRVDKARSRELGGTGLGLSIVKHIVELHGGTAGVESTEGLGSKFWFTLPI